MGPGYEIGASLANDTASETDPLQYAGTTFIFGNSDNPNASAESTPVLTSTATGTTALPGGEATSNVSTPTATGGAATSSGSSLETLLLLGGGALVVLILGVVFVLHFFKK